MEHAKSRSPFALKKGIYPLIQLLSVLFLAAFAGLASAATAGKFSTSLTYTSPHPKAFPVCDPALDNMTLDEVWSHSASLEGQGVSQSRQFEAELGRIIIQIPQSLADELNSGQPITKRYPVYFDIAGVNFPPEKSISENVMNMFSSSGFIAVGYSQSDSLRPLVDSIMRPAKARCALRWLRREGYLHTLKMRALVNQSTSLSAQQKQSMLSQLTTDRYLKSGVDIPQDFESDSNDFVQANPGRIFLPVDPDRIVIRGQSLGGTTASNLTMVSEADWQNLLDALFGKEDDTGEDGFLEKLFSNASNNPYKYARPPYSAPDLIGLTRESFPQNDYWKEFREEIRAGVVTSSGGDYLTIASACEKINSRVVDASDPQGSLKPGFLRDGYGELFENPSSTLGKFTCGALDPSFLNNIDNPLGSNNIQQLVHVQKPLYYPNGTPLAGQINTASAQGLRWDDWRMAQLYNLLGVHGAQGRYVKTTNGLEYGQDCYLAGDIEQVYSTDIVDSNPVSPDKDVQTFFGNVVYSQAANYYGITLSGYQGASVDAKTKYREQLTMLYRKYLISGMKSACTFVENTHGSGLGSGDDDINPPQVALDRAAIELASIMSAVTYAGHTDMSNEYLPPLFQIVPFKDTIVEPLTGLMSARMARGFGHLTLSMTEPSGNHWTTDWNEWILAYVKMTSDVNFENSTASFESLFLDYRNTLTYAGIPIVDIIEPYLGSNAMPTFLPSAQYYFCYLINPRKQACDIFATDLINQ